MKPEVAYRILMAIRQEDRCHNYKKPEGELYDRKNLVRLFVIGQQWPAWN